jgi:hypothetical protein
MGGQGFIGAALSLEMLHSDVYVTFFITEKVVGDWTPCSLLSFMH